MSEHVLSQNFTTSESDSNWVLRTLLVLLIESVRWTRLPVLQTRQWGWNYPFNIRESAISYYYREREQYPFRRQILKFRAIL